VIPGAVLTTVGLILLYQHATASYQTWAYAWALIPAAVGVGMIVQGARDDQEWVLRGGTRVAGMSVAVFLLFGAFFELVLHIGGDSLISKSIWPVALVAVGVGAIAYRHARPTHQVP
jgi:hypothetical protein